MKLYRILTIFILFAAIQIKGFCVPYVYKKLNSGQTVIVYEIKDNPIVTLNTWVKTGSINEDDTNTGVAHFLEHLFFKGSKNTPPGEFDKILESKGALTNAATSKDYTQFYITIPSSDFDLALKLHSDMLLNPLIPRKELEKERLVVLEEINRGLDNPSNVLYNNIFKLIYSTNNDHPYKRPVIGSKDVISTISREEILDFYNKWYTPDNMITIVSGDVDAAYAAGEIEKAFNTQNVPKHQKTEKKKIVPIDKTIKIEEKRDVAQGYMAIGYKAPKFTNAKETYALDLLALILGGSNSSILTTELKEKNRLVNSINASYSQYMDDGIFFIFTNFETDKKVLDIQNKIFNEIEKVKLGGITKEQLQKAKNMMRTSTSYARESAANIANELGFFTFYYGTPKMYDDYLTKIDSVNLKDITAAANKFLDNNKTAISTVLPENYIEISNTAHAAKVLPGGAEIIEKTGKETKYLLDNGAVLIVRKNNTNSILAFDIYAKGGKFLAEDTAAAYLAAHSAVRGTKTKNREEINDFFDENGIRFSTSAGADNFNISMQITKNRLEDGLMILDEIVNYPSFNSSEIDKVRKNFKEYVKTLQDKPLSYALDEYTGLVYESIPYSFNNKKTAEIIDEVQDEDIISYYSKILDAKNIVITAAGDVDDELMIKEFNKIFKDKGQKKVEIKDFYKQTEDLSSDRIKKLSNNGKETSWILIGYRTIPIYNVKEIATLRVIDSLMGTGMSSRLFRSLRENRGLAYQVGSQIHQFGNEGSFFAYIGTNSKNEKAAADGILAEFNRLKTEFVPNKELEEAKEKLLGNMIIALETNMDRAEFLSKYTAFGFDLNFLEELKNEIKNVNASDILSFANKYFSKPYVEVIIGKE